MKILLSQDQLKEAVSLYVSAKRLVRDGQYTSDFHWLTKHDEIELELTLSDPETTD